MKTQGLIRFILNPFVIFEICISKFRFICFSHILEDVPQITIQIIYAGLVAKEFSLTTSISVAVSSVSLFSGVLGKSLLWAATKQQRREEKHKHRLAEAVDTGSDDALAVLLKVLSKPGVQAARGRQEGGIGGHGPGCQWAGSGQW